MYPVTELAEATDDIEALLSIVAVPYLPFWLSKELVPESMHVLFCRFSKIYNFKTLAILEASLACVLAI